MIEKNKIRVQQNKLCDNGGPPIANAIIVTGDPSRLAPRHLKRKRGTNKDDSKDLPSLTFSTHPPYDQLSFL